MTYTQYTAAQAGSRAKSFVSWRTNYCLNFTRTMIHGTNTIGLPDAKSAYYAAKQHVMTGNPPAGAPVYWKTFNHPYWHIAVSVGGGYVRSTDYPYKGRVGTVAISTLTRIWGMQYLGWSRDLAGLAIKGLEIPTKIPTTNTASIPAPYNYSEVTKVTVNDEALRPGVRSTSAKVVNARMWSWLYWNGGSAGRSYCVQNYKAWMAESSSVWGQGSINAMRKIYTILDAVNQSGGWESGKTATYPGAGFLSKIGARAD